MDTIRAWAAEAAGAALRPFSYKPGALGLEEVEIAVNFCGLCHSDLSMRDNEWGITAYPFVPGHEVVGRVVAMGPQVRGLSLGQMVGLGWLSDTCHVCDHCQAGDGHLCAQAQPTIVNRYGGFAERVRADWRWVIPLPGGVSTETAGPLFCGGITVFSPFVEFNVSPLSRVGVVGIGGLGHLALQFARAWGCEVTAFTSNAAKGEAAKVLGAHQVVSSTDKKAIFALAGQLDLIIVTANVSLPWDALLAALSVKGRLHVVGAVLDSIPVKPFALIGGQKSLSGSPVGSARNMARMLDFCARHQIAPTVEAMPMSQANEALSRLAAGQAQYRIVLANDF